MNNSNANRAILKYFFCFSTSHAPKAATTAYINQVDKTVAGIPSQTANESWFIQIIILFISPTDNVTNFPAYTPTKGTHEKATKIISAYKIKLESGTAIILDTKNKLGNW